MIEQVIIALGIAVAFGLLEAAWTYPGGSGGPHKLWLGVFAIALGLFVVTFPFFWWISALAILEEMTHLYATGGRLTWDRIFNHWSKKYIGVNIYPYITFPLITIIGQVVYWVVLA